MVSQKYSLRLVFTQALQKLFVDITKEIIFLFQTESDQQPSIQHFYLEWNPVGEIKLFQFSTFNWWEECRLYQRVYDLHNRNISFPEFGKLNYLCEFQVQITIQYIEQFRKRKIWGYIYLFVFEDNRYRLVEIPGHTEYDWIFEVISFQTLCSSSNKQKLFPIGFVESTENEYEIIVLLQCHEKNKNLFQQDLEDWHDLHPSPTQDWLIVL